MKLRLRKAQVEAPKRRKGGKEKKVALLEGVICPACKTETSLTDAQRSWAYVGGVRLPSVDDWLDGYYVCNTECAASWMTTVVEALLDRSEKELRTHKWPPKVVHREVK